MGDVGQRKQEQAAALWRLGWTQQQIADRLCVSVGSVSNAVSRMRDRGASLEKRKPGRKPRPTAAQRVRLLVLLGWKAEEAAHAVGVPRATACQWANGAGEARRQARALMRGGA